LEGLGKGAAAKNAYLRFLKIKDKADRPDPLVADVLDRLKSL
jgi:hypothetical protein